MKAGIINNTPRLDVAISHLFTSLISVRNNPCAIASMLKPAAGTSNLSPLAFAARHANADIANKASALKKAVCVKLCTGYKDPITLSIKLKVSPPEMK